MKCFGNLKLLIPPNFFYPCPVVKIKVLKDSRVPTFDKDSVYIFYGPGKPLNPSFDDFFKKGSTYLIYKVRSPFYCLIKGQLPQFFLAIDSLIRNGVPVVGVSIFHDEKWYTVRKKTGIFEAINKKVFVQNIEQKGIMVIAKECEMKNQLA